MKMLFSSTDPVEVKSVSKKLSQAGIACEIRDNPIAQGIFGIPPAPELWIKKDSDILKALKSLGPRRLRQMTVVLQRL